jgi:peptide/nickel transport system permease protein
LLQAVVVVWLAYTLVFVAVSLLPGDPVTLYLSQDSTPDPQVLATMRHQYGYDQPLLVQYLHSLGGLFTGDLGYSLASGQPAAQRIGSVIGSTLQLASGAFVLAVVIALAISIAATLVPADRSGFLRWLKSFLIGLPPFFASVPVFWLGLVALQVLALRLDVMSLFPDGSLMSSLIPMLVLGLHLSAALAQVLLKSLDTVYAQPYVEALRARGVGEARILFSHGLKNAAAPALTIAGVTVGTLLAGSIITETVFARAGLGQLVLQAVSAQDLPLIQALVLLTAVVFVCVNLVVDLIHPLLDPRVLRGSQGGAGGSKGRALADDEPTTPELKAVTA